MIFVDTSAWIEYLRDTGSEVCELVKDSLETGDDAVISDAVRLEVLAGGRNEAHLVTLHDILDKAVVIPTLQSDYEQAAELYRRCRAGGETIRNLMDCLIAAVAIRVNAPVLHRDSDFEALARHTELRTSHDG